MSIKKILDQIAAEPSTNKKMDILYGYKDNELLKRVLYLAYSPRIKFYIKQIPSFLSNPDGNMSLPTALDLLSELSSRRKTGHDASNHLRQILSQLSLENAQVVIKIIEKDCKLGMGVTNINKKFDDYIEDTPYMGAKAFKPKEAKKIFEKGGKGFSQIKMDGRYANAIICDGVVEPESRAGEQTRIMGAKCIAELSKFKNCVLNGEFTVNVPKMKADGTMKTGTEIRYESNGLIASLVSIGNKKAEGKNVSKEIAKFKDENGYDYQETLDNIQYTIWDMITLEEYDNTESSLPYHERLKNVENILLEHKPENIFLIESIPVESYEEALDHFSKVLEAGLEGTILKSQTGTWKDGKPAWQIKMKLEMDVDMRIVKFNYGKAGTKNERNEYTCRRIKLVFGYKKIWRLPACWFWAWV